MCCSGSQHHDCMMQGICSGVQGILSELQSQTVILSSIEGYVAVLPQVLSEVQQVVLLLQQTESLLQQANNWLSQVANIVNDIYLVLSGSVVSLLGSVDSSLSSLLVCCGNTNTVLGNILSVLNNIYGAIGSYAVSVGAEINATRVVTGGIVMNAATGNTAVVDNTGGFSLVVGNTLTLIGGKKVKGLIFTNPHSVLPAYVNGATLFPLSVKKYMFPEGNIDTGSIGMQYIVQAGGILEIEYMVW